MQISSNYTILALFDTKMGVELSIYRLFCMCKINLESKFQINLESKLQTYKIIIL